jgi:hypothetical protein
MQPIRAPVELEAGLVAYAKPLGLASKVRLVFFPVLYM